MKASYSYQIIIEDGLKFLSIIDLDRTNFASVTNCIESVIEEIRSKEGLKDDLYVVYSDSRGIWDAYDEKKGSFISLNVYTSERAIEIYIKKLTDQFFNHITDKTPDEFFKQFEGKVCEFTYKDSKLGLIMVHAKIVKFDEFILTTAMSGFATSTIESICILSNTEPGRL